MIPVIFFPSIIPSDGDIETNTVLGLVDAYHIPNYLSETASTGNILMSVPDDTTDHLNASFGIIDNTTKSILKVIDDAAYRVGTTGKVKLVLQVRSGATSVTFKIWKSSSLDSATGTTVYDFTSTALDSKTVTTPVIIFDATANDYINVQTTVANGIQEVKAWIVEFPA